MKPLSSSPFLVLLQSVYQKMGGDEVAVKALLDHCGELVRDPNYGPGPKDSKIALRAFAFLKPSTGAQQLAGAEGASKIRTALVEIVPPWKDDGVGGKAGWGWMGLQMAVNQNDPQTVRALIQHPNAPSIQEINDYVFTYFEADKNVDPKSTPSMGNLAGVLMMEGTIGGTFDQLGQTVKAMIECGVDFNRPISEGGQLPMGYAGSEKMVEQLLNNGVRADGKMPDGTSALTLAFANICSAWHPNLVGYCTNIAQTQPEIAEHIKNTWPELIQAWAVQFSKSRNNYALGKEIQGLAALSDVVGMPLGSKRKEDPNFFAAWARAKLALFHEQSFDYNDIQRFPDWQDITKGLEIPNKWTGEMEPGIPNGAWGLLVAAQNEGYRKDKSFSREKSNWFTAGQGEAFWEGTFKLFEKLSAEPCVWSAVHILQSCIPKSMLKDFRRVAMRGFIKNKQSNSEKAMRSFKEGGFLVNVASQCLKPIVKGASEIYDPELVNLALRVHLLNGMRGSIAMQALEIMIAQHPQHLDKEGLQTSLQFCQNETDEEMYSRMQAVVLSLQAPTASLPTRASPRL